MNETILNYCAHNNKNKQGTWCSNCSAGSVCLCHKIQQQKTMNFLLEVKT